MQRFKKFPSILQLNSQDCGLTCIQIINSYYGIRIPMSNAIYESIHTEKQGISVGDLEKAAKLIGYNTMLIQLDYEKMLDNIFFPAIFHWNQNHFIVVYKIAKNKIYVSDPAFGKVTYSKEDFIKGWKQNHAEGVILLLEPTEKIFEHQIPTQNEKSTYSYVIQYLKTHRTQLFLISLTLLLSSCVELIFPFFMQKIIDKGVVVKNLSFIYVVLLAQIAVFLSRVGLEFYRSWLFIHIGSRISLTIISDFLLKIMKLPLKYYNSKNIGDFTQRIQDHKRIEAFLSKDLIQAVFASFSILIYLAVLLYFNTSIFFVVITMSILQSAWILKFMEKIKVLDRKLFTLYANDQNKIYELINSIQEVKLNNLEEDKIHNWKNTQKRIYTNTIEKTRMNQKYESYRFINFFQMILVIFVASLAVMNNQLTIGTMLAIMFILSGLSIPTTQIINFFLQYQLVKVSFERLNEIHVKKDEKNGQISNYLEAELQDLCFKNVSFSYNGNHTILNHINLTIPKGKTTAIVGVSGSGKTSLLKLLLKFYEPQEGSIFIGSHAIQDIENSTWREKCGVILQDSFIFSDTIAYNIALTNQPNIEKLNTALKLANIYSFIESLPLKTETTIGMEGIGLSQGQKQRILIARAIYKNPDYLFFDEATNSLDAENEKVIVDNINTFFKNKTMILVAHRLSTVKNADQIIVINDGLIIERGTHNQLIEQKGKYYNLIKDQLELGT